MIKKVPIREKGLVCVANVLVFGPGGYRFFDYARVGAWLTVALLIVSMIFLPLLWPLFP